MHFAEILDRVSSFPDLSIAFYDEAGEVVRKSYPTVHTDVMRTINQLQRWGVKPAMRIGILATNSYEWVCFDLALMRLKCTSVAFPEEFGGKTSAELIEKYQLSLLLLSRRDQWPTISPGKWTAYIDDDNPPHTEVRRVPSQNGAEQPIFSLTFSSGTAGRIKCLVTNETGAEETIASFYSLFDFRSDDSFLVFLPLSSFQQRLMVYAGFYYGFNLLLVNPSQVMKAFKDLKPTLCLAPPLLYESIHTQFKNAVRNLGPAQRLTLSSLSKLGGRVPSKVLRKRIFEFCYGKIYASLGGRIRIMWTGMAPIKRSTLDFFARLRLPLYEAYGLTECGAIATNTPSHNRRGSVGRPVVEGSVFLAEDGEIMVRQEHLQTTSYLECDGEEQARTYVAPNVVATGDIGSFDDDGFLYLIGRKKELIITEQGYKVHPESLEALIDRCPEVERAVVFGNGLSYLVALISIQEPRSARVAALIKKSIDQINAGLIPIGRIARFVVTTDQFTRDNGFLTRNLKLDRRAIFKHFETQLLGHSFEHEQTVVPPEGAGSAVSPAPAAADEVKWPDLAKTIVAVWQDVLAVAEVRRNDNFFDLGGNSLLLSEMQNKLQQALECEIPVIELFNHPTVGSLVNYLTGPPRDLSTTQSLAKAAQAGTQTTYDKQSLAADDNDGFARSEETGVPHEPIAIIGLAGRFPGADSADGLWRNLCQGIESVSFFSDEELSAAGVSPRVFNHPNYIKAKPVLDDMDLFDASFFGFNPREAEIMDPQHRVLLECAWDALESAGYHADNYQGRIGVYAGASLSTYVFNALVSLNGLESLGALQHLAIGNGLWSLATRVSYKLNLRGPSVTVQTACSTSLAAVHLACQSLLARECDMALAGGVSIIIPNREGYHYQEGGVFSPDGHCRAFDVKAKGTIVGDGVGLVVLKRLREAIVDRDFIHAVILGSAMNNDGSGKVGFTAPSADGQAEVIAAAHVKAGVTADSIGYVEAHGTGTPLGDPIEVQALSRAFRASTDRKVFCGLGSIKTNIGHLDTAAGVAGLIKTALALQHKLLPPSLHFEQPNPQIDFANSPFYVNTSLTQWDSNGQARRAGVSSFGLGGTNVHVVMEEAPADAPSGPARPWNLLVLSARSEQALAAANANLKTHLKLHPELEMADVAYTHQVGRKPFPERQVIVCRDVEDSLKVLETGDSKRILTASLRDDEEPFVVFMFPGQGAQHVNMAAELYQTEQTFREVVDRCCLFLTPHLGFDLRRLMFADEERVKETATKLQQTSVTQPALFVIEYALAQLWLEWGVRPQAMIGHSIGEYVAACLAGVFSLEDALSLVAARGKLIGDLPGGAMLAIPCSEDEAKLFLNEELSLAAINSPWLSVISGPTEAIDRLEQKLTVQGLICHRLHTSHAFHSAMVDPILASFSELVTKARPQVPQVPLISNVTGTWIKNSEATDPQYWTGHLRHTVRFADGLQTLSEKPRLILLEVGPGQNLSGLAGGQLDRSTCSVISSLSHPRNQQSDSASLLTALGKVWLAGTAVDWSGFNAHQERRRLPLPTYPFERRRYWVEAQPLAAQNHSEQVTRKPDVSDWFYVPGWKQSPSPLLFALGEPAAPEGNWLLFVDQCGMGERLARQLTRQGQVVVTVRAGEQLVRSGDNNYVINPRVADDYTELLKQLVAEGKTPRKIIHFWNVSQSDGSPLKMKEFDNAQDLGLHSLVYLARAIGQESISTPLELFVVSNGLHAVVGNEELCPAKATLLSPCKVIPQEYPQLKCRSIDVCWPPTEAHEESNLIDSLLSECSSRSEESVVAYRQGNRWLPTYEPVHLGDNDTRSSVLRERGVYLIIGGLEGIGTVIAEYLSQTVRARLVWLQGLEVPQRSNWEHWLLTHEEQDPTSIAISRVQAIEKLGASVVIATADVANLDQMQAVVKQTLEQYGELNGIFYAAGPVPMGEESAQTIQDVAALDYQVHFQPKVTGLIILEQVLQGLKPDFCLIISSISSVLGGLGLTAYTAANLFIDAFARYCTNRTPLRWTTINLDAWQVDAQSGAQTPTNLGASLAELAISTSEGKEVISRLFPLLGFPQIVVSTAALQSRIDRWVKLVSFREVEQTRKAPGSFYPRPSLLEPYVTPRNDVESKTAEVWQQVLGIEQVGINDDFFELGGNSLLATQLVMRMREAFQSALPLRDFFETPTVAGLSTIIARPDGPAAAPQSLKIKAIPRDSIRINRSTLRSSKPASDLSPAAKSSQSRPQVIP
jgi:acyl transferase domain-containing protein/long-subunit acyl-CoA synthetase (AMP-forming)/acyl carrier protein